MLQVFIWYWVGAVISFLIGICYAIICESILTHTEVSGNSLVLYIKGISLFTLCSWVGVTVFLLSYINLVKKYSKGEYYGK